MFINSISLVLGWKECWPDYLFISKLIHSVQTPSKYPWQSTRSIPLMTQSPIRPIISDGHYPNLSISTHQVSKVMCCASIIHILINLFAKCSVGWVRVSGDLFVVSIKDICSTQVLEMLKLKRYYFIQRQGVQTIGVNRSSKLLILINFYCIIC